MRDGEGVRRTGAASNAVQRTQHTNGQRAAGGAGCVFLRPARCQGGPVVLIAGGSWRPGARSVPLSVPRSTGSTAPSVFPGTLACVAALVGRDV